MIRRNKEEDTPVDEFRRFSETNLESKAVENDNQGLPEFSQVAYHSLSGSFLQLSLRGSLSGFMILLTEGLYC